MVIAGANHRKYMQDIFEKMPGVSVKISPILNNFIWIVHRLYNNNMQKSFAGSLALAGWFAVIAQYILMLNNSVITTGEATLRFFSYFTILTNIAVAGYFTAVLFNASFTKRRGIIGDNCLYYHRWPGIPGSLKAYLGPTRASKTG
ncbi:hypothetical protein LWM68_03045 [Niabella sp. W65]|nr:hypothetical protein [Niabella sp. W65]MCH7361844.1 hypothetical protein [Niabella sp. W65]ULT45605.1 hypothetical protein KRR40_21585 [Niabella sp. I65]